MDNFADAPVSLAEKRAEKEHDATLWGPRDALVSMLRDIDSGMEVSALIVVYRRVDDGDRGVFYQAAGVVDKVEGMGMLGCVSQIIGEQK